MITDQVDHTVAAIDEALSSEDITDLVDWQLSRYDERSGYDHHVNQPARCGHCGREEHGLAITERIESMRWQGFYDKDYRYDEDTSPLLCPGSYVPGPVGFRRAHDHEQLHASWGNALGAVTTYARGGRIEIPQGLGQDFALTTDCAAPWVVVQPNPWVRLSGVIQTSQDALAPLMESAASAWGAIQHAATVLNSTPVTVRLIDGTGRPIPLRDAKGSNLQPTDTGFTIKLDLPPRGLRAAVRDRGPGARIIVEGPAGARERIAGTVADVSLTDDGARFELDVTSEHHRLPAVYTEPEETHP
ncbi:hypothetical protein FK268_09255 [Tsukamurella sputi]|uniref:Uncharacterized protein n=1 Tax=Tsukamurella sputi TaxID=2591848 RepID=A0A5C5RQU2_9ACTN|nr:hypothetical protein [Tsukamurella sputi]TWS25367.1 hypothetical protein FK268_09255 [Tsukamurella sputi]